MDMLTMYQTASQLESMLTWGAHQESPWNRIEYAPSSYTEYAIRVNEVASDLRPYNVKAELVPEADVAEVYRTCVWLTRDKIRNISVWSANHAPAWLTLRHDSATVEAQPAQRTA
jgi:hypothetical protein